MRALLLLPFAVMAWPVPAQEPARSLAASCAQCHGTDGRSVAKSMPSIAGMPREALVARMREFRSGKRAGSVMPRIARGYDDEQIELIAAYLAARR